MRRRSFLKGGLVLSAAYPYTVSSSMTTYKTGNPIGSESPKDLYDNTQNLDILLNHPTKTEHPDRLGVPRKTWHGMEQDFQQFLVNSGYTGTGAGGAYEDYDADGPLTIDALNQVFTKDGEFYRLKPDQAIPYTTSTWATDEVNMVAVGDAALRQELAGGLGALMVKGSEYAVADLNDLVSLDHTKVPNGQNFRVDGVSGGSFIWDDSSSDAENGLTIFSPSSSPATGRYKRVIEGLPRLSWSGITGGNIQSGFDSLVEYASAQGFASIILDGTDFTLSEFSDGKGLRIVGSGQKMLSGSFSNISEVIGIEKNGHFTDEKITIPSPIKDDTAKAVLRYADDEYWIINGSPGYYSQNVFARNETTTQDSIASTTSDPTTLRLTQNRPLVGCWVAHHVATASSGWAVVSLASGEIASIPSFTGGAPISYRRSGGVTGNYIEYTNVQEVGGYVRIAYISRPGSCTDVSITINGSSAGSFDFSGGSDAIRYISVPMARDSATIRITQNAGGIVEVIGPNFYELSEWAGQSANSIWYLRDSNKYSDNLFSSSANDFVVKETGSGLYGFSYHGGEESIDDRIYSNGVEVSVSIGSFIITKNLEIISKCSVNWVTFGGSGELSLTKKHNFFSDGVSSTFNLSGNAEVSELYTFMHGCDSGLSFVVTPEFYSIDDDVENDTFLHLGRTNKIEMKNGATGQRFIAELAVFDREENKNNGAWIWKRRSSNPFNKLYYGPVMQGRRDITGMGWVSNYYYQRA